MQSQNMQSLLKVGPEAGRLQRRVSATRRPSLIIEMPAGSPVVQIVDPLVVASVRNEELPSAGDANAIPSPSHAKVWGARALAGATFVLMLWSVINYVAPRGTGDTSGRPSQPDWEFD